MTEGRGAKDQGTAAGEVSCCIMLQQDASHGEGTHGTREQETGMGLVIVTNPSCNN